MANISFHPNTQVHSAGTGTKIKSAHHFNIFDSSHTLPASASLGNGSSDVSTSIPVVAVAPNAISNGTKLTIPGSIVRAINITDASKLFAKRINGQATLTPITLTNGNHGGANVITLSHVKAATAAAAASGSPANSASLGTFTSNSGNNYVIYNIKTDSVDHSKPTVLLAKNATLMASNQPTSSLKYMGNNPVSGEQSEIKPLIIYPQLNSLGSTLSNSSSLNNETVNVTSSILPSMTSVTNVNSSVNRCPSTGSNKKLKLEIKEELTNHFTTSIPLLSSVTTNKRASPPKLVETTNDFVDPKTATVNTKSPELLTKPVSKSNIENCLPLSCNSRLSLNSCIKSKFYSLNSITPYLPDEIFDTDEEDFSDDDSQQKTNVTLGKDSVSLLSTTTITSEEECTSNKDKQCHPKVEIKTESQDDQDMITEQEKEYDSTKSPILPVKEEIVEGEKEEFVQITTVDTAETKFPPPNVPKKGAIISAMTEKIIGRIGKNSSTRVKQMSIAHIITSLSENGTIQNMNKPAMNGKITIVKGPSKSATNMQMQLLSYQEKREQIWRILIQEISSRRDRMFKTKEKAMENRKFLARECELFAKKRIAAVDGNTTFVVVKRRPSFSKTTSNLTPNGGQIVQSIIPSAASANSISASTTLGAIGQTSQQQRTITLHLTPNQLNSLSSSLLFVSRSTSSSTSTSLSTTTTLSGVTKLTNGNSSITGPKTITLSQTSFPMILTTSKVGTTPLKTPSFTTKRTSQLIVPASQLSCSSFDGGNQ